MRKLRAFFLMAVLFTASSTLLAQSTTDIAQIINKFVSTNSAGGVGWNFFKENSRVRRLDNNLVSEGYQSKLRFASSLTMNGSPIFENEIGDAGMWDITLRGARVGAHLLNIDAFLIYKDPEEVIRYLTQKLAMRKTSIPSDHQYYDYSAIYSAKGSYILISYSRGATGCGDISINVAKESNDLKGL